MKAALLVLLALTLTSCTKPLRGWSLEGADVSIHYERGSDSLTDLSTSSFSDSSASFSSKSSKKEQFRARHVQGQNAGGAQITFRFRYDLPTRKATSTRSALAGDRGSGITAASSDAISE